MWLRNSSAPVVLAAILTGFVSVFPSRGAQVRRFAPNSWAFRHSVKVFGPNRPIFQAVLKRDFPGATEVDYFHTIQPSLAIIHNNTQHVIKAYAVKWTITNADGSTQTAYLHVMPEPSPGDWRLVGTATVLGRAGTGWGTQLISPFFNWPRRDFGGFLKVNLVWGAFQAASENPIISSIQGAASVQVSLDGVIFGDGVFVGPDTSKLFEWFQAEQKAQVDEAAWMQSEVEGGLTDQQLRDALSEQIYKDRRATGTDVASVYTAARGEAASRLLSLLDNLGQAVVGNISSQLAGAKPLTLRRLSGR